MEDRRILDPHVAELIASVARVGAGVERIDEKVDDLRETSVKRLDAHAGKIRSLELTRSRQRGIAAALGAVGAAAASFFTFLKS